MHGFSDIMIGRGYQPEIVTMGAGWVREFEKVVELQWTKVMDNIETDNKGLQSRWGGVGVRYAISSYKFVQIFFKIQFQPRFVELCATEIICMELTYQINQNPVQPDLINVISRIVPNEILVCWTCGNVSISTVIEPESTAILSCAVVTRPIVIAVVCRELVTIVIRHRIVCISRVSTDG